MTEIWMYSIPVTIAMAGFFLFFLAEAFLNTREHKPFVMSLFFWAFLLVFDAVVLLSVLISAVLYLCAMISAARATCSASEAHMDERKTTRP